MAKLIRFPSARNLIVAVYSAAVEECKNIGPDADALSDIFTAEAEFSPREALQPRGFDGLVAGVAISESSLPYTAERRIDVAELALVNGREAGRHDGFAIKPT
ncbi:MAG TPA: hypothetical protein VL754_07350 [Verrucomicrobiae bacterium]|jgi:hypothetical protein|nr:hypothetical protein [Verrucomicrobiae bacterium]